MTFKEMQDELVNMRFGEGRRDNIVRWLNHRERQIWNSDEWPFKRVFRESWSVTSGTPTMPIALHKVIAIERSDGTVLNRMEELDFRKTYLVSDTQTDDPTDFAVIDGQVYLGPAPTTSATFYISYTRGVCHFNNSGALTTGLMSADTDYPIFDSGFHYIVPIGATSTGLKMENDLTWQPLEDEFQLGLQDMREYYLPPDGYGTTQYGRDDLE